MGRHDRANGFPGASAEKVKKLFSAAEWWGPGETGWTQCDDTWLCTDQKDFFGRVLKAQGRMIWRLATRNDLEYDHKDRCIPAREVSSCASESSSLGMSWG